MEDKPPAGRGRGRGRGRAPTTAASPGPEPRKPQEPSSPAGKFGWSGHSPGLVIDLIISCAGVGSASSSPGGKGVSGSPPAAGLPGAGRGRGRGRGRTPAQVDLATVEAQAASGGGGGDRGVSSALKSPLRDEKALQDVIQQVEEVALVEKKEEVTKKVEEMQGSCH